MNDLIKRSDVLETLESVFKKYNIAYGQEYGGFAEAVPESIKNIPTACDVDKVVEQVENYLFEKYCIDGDSKIEEIVKGGGENE